MKILAEHVLTERQLTLVRDGIEAILPALGAEDSSAAEDLLETLDTNIHGSKQTVTVTYELEDAKP